MRIAAEYDHSKREGEREREREREREEAGETVAIIFSAFHSGSATDGAI